MKSAECLLPEVKKMTSFYIPRMMDTFLKEKLAVHRGVMLIGPRGVGKTSTAGKFAKTIFKLDDPADREFVERDTDQALAGPYPILLDEWQRWPHVLWKVKRNIDGGNQPGMFIVTGSARNDQVADQWPITGRLIRVRMWGLAGREIFGQARAVPLFDRWDDKENRFSLLPELPHLGNYLELALGGGLPEVLSQGNRVDQVSIQASYIDQISTIDLPSLAAPGTRSKEPAKFRAYLESYALNTAGVVPHTTIYEPIGINQRTANGYLEALISLGMVDELPPWTAKPRKRLITDRFKRHFADPGLAAAAAGLSYDSIYFDSDLIGRFIDSFVTAQLRVEAEVSHNIRLFHLRTANGDHEVDVVAQRGRQLIGFEVKAGAEPTRKDARHLIWFRDEIAKERFAGGVVFHTGRHYFEMDQDIYAVPIAGLWGPNLPISS